MTYRNRSPQLPAHAMTWRCALCNADRPWGHLKAMFFGDEYVMLCNRGAHPTCYEGYESGRLSRRQKKALAR